MTKTECEKRVLKNFKRRNSSGTTHGKVGRPRKSEGTTKQIATRQHKREQHELKKVLQPTMDAFRDKVSEAGFPSVESFLEAAAKSPYGNGELQRVKAGLTCLRNTASLVTHPPPGSDKGRMYLKKPIIANLGAGLSPQEMEKSFGISYRTAKKACLKSTREQCQTLPEFVQPKRAGETRKKVHDQEINSTVEHFRRHLHVKSGASTANSLLLDKPLETVYREYRKEYPSFLADWSFESPGTLMTRTELNRALYNLGVREVAPWTKDDYRRKKNKRTRSKTRSELTPDMAKYEIVIDGGEMRINVSTVGDECRELQGESPSKDKPDNMPNLGKHVDGTSKLINPRSYMAWRKILLIHGPKFRVVKAPYFCEICQRAARVKRDYRHTLNELEEKQAKGTVTAKEVARLKGLLADYEPDYQNVLRHEEQMETQREYIIQREKELKPGGSEVIVYEDFVAQYNLEGKKVANLVFVVIWRDEEGNTQRKYIDNYCSDHSKKQDSMFVEHVWAWHLRPNEIRNRLAQTGPSRIDDKEREKLLSELQQREKVAAEEFKGVTHIIRTGDSGGHFHSR